MSVSREQSINEGVTAVKGFHIQSKWGWAVLILAVSAVIASVYFTAKASWGAEVDFGHSATTEQVGHMLQKLQQTELLAPSVGYCVPDTEGRSDLVKDGTTIGHLQVRVWLGEPMVASMMVTTEVAQLTPVPPDTRIRVMNFYGGEWKLGDTTSSLDYPGVAKVWRMSRTDGTILQGWSLIEGGQLLGLKVARAPREVK